jgi:hypothetical protein
MRDPPNVHLDLTDRELRALGMVAANWALTEAAVETVLAGLVQFPLPKGQSNPAKLPFPRRVAKLVVLAQPRIRASTHWRLNVLAAHLLKAQDTRNEYLHAVWTTGGDIEPAFALSMRMDKSMRQQQMAIGFSDIPVEDIENAAKTIRRIGGVFYRFAMQQGLFPPP